MRTTFGLIVLFVSFVDNHSLSFPDQALTQLLICVKLFLSLQERIDFEATTWLYDPVDVYVLLALESSFQDWRFLHPVWFRKHLNSDYVEVAALALKADKKIDHVFGEVLWVRIIIICSDKILYLLF